MNDCLILVDLQNDYFAGGQMKLDAQGDFTSRDMRLLL